MTLDGAAAGITERMKGQNMKQLRQITRAYSGRGETPVLVLKLPSGKTRSFTRIVITDGYTIEQVTQKPSLFDFRVDDNGALYIQATRAGNLPRWR